MTNFQLFVLALIPLVAAVWLSVKRTSAAAAPAVLAIILLLLALGGPVWEWSKVTGFGLPPTVKAAPFSESKAVPAFLWASIGAGLSALLVPPVAPETLPTRTVMPSRNLSIVVAVVSVVTFVIFLLGEGPSFLKREVYLDTDGIMFCQHVAWPFGAVVGLTGIAMAAWEKDRRLRLFLIATGVLWSVGPACVGSRTACAGPIVGSVLIIYQEIRRRRLHLPMVAAALGLFITVFFTFSLVSKSREIPHGLLNVPNVVQATVSDVRDSTDSILLPVKRLVASVYEAFPVAEESVRSDVTDALLDNANPLPGTAQSPDLERYWPYGWVPLAFAGEWFAAMGWVGQILIFGAIGWIYGLTMHNLQRSRFHLMSFLPLGLVAVVGFLSIEYPSRMVWRVISISVCILIASYLVRDRSRHMARGRGVELPRIAFGNLEESTTSLCSTLKGSTRVATTIGARYG